MAEHKILRIRYELRYDPFSKKKQDNNVENFYTHHRMKIYDEDAVKDLNELETWKKGEDVKKYTFGIDEKLLEEYKAHLEIHRYLERMSGNNLYSVVIQPNRSPLYRIDEYGQNWNKKYKEYKKKYDERSAKLLAECDVTEDDSAPQYNYFITIFSKGLSGLLQQLFVSTLAYEECKEKWPEGVPRESFEIEYDLTDRTSKLVDINIYNPDTPFNKFIRRNLRVFIHKNKEQSGNDEIIDFYSENRITGWIPYNEQEFADKEKSDENTVGVYMLYDSLRGHFYVGKAEKVYTRMKQHRDSPNPNEPIRNFDYYRYSLIDPYYYDDIFLVENAAIHDGAMILNMRHNKDYEDKSLAKLIEGFAEGQRRNIADITMVNNVKKQTKRASKKSNTQVT